MIFQEIPEFKKEFKKLFKKYKSLDKDLKKFKNILKIFPCGNGSKHWNELYKNSNFFVFKSRLSCAYLKRNSLRIIYSYNEKEKVFCFLEIYFKGDKISEDKGRIKRHIKDLDLK